MFKQQQRAGTTSSHDWCAGLAGAGVAAAAPDQAPAKLSSHERRMARMAERARALEAQNMGDKQWFLRGEANAGAPDWAPPLTNQWHQASHRTAVLAPAHLAKV